MNDDCFYIGCPVEFKNLCLVYPPTYRQALTNKKFNIYIKILTLSQEEVEDEYTESGADLSNLLTPFEYLLNSAFNNKELNILIKEAFEFFIHEPINFLFTQKTIVIGDIDSADLNEIRLLKEEDFFDFQNLVRQSLGEKIVELPDPNENPKIKAMKAKARYRDKIKAKSKDNLAQKTILASICCMGLGITPLNIGELSYATVQLLLATYQEKEKYNIDIDSLLAGADSKKVKPKYWIRNLDND